MRVNADIHEKLEINYGKVIELWIPTDLSVI